MNVFHCDHCRQLLFFENVRCLRCDHTVAYLPELRMMGSLEPAGEGTWRSPVARTTGRTFRLCANYERENVCNWALAADDAGDLCLSCRLTRVIPDLGRPGRREAWYRLEAAKRRLLYSLLALGLPLQNKDDDPDQGLAFEFREDADHANAAPVLTGHAHGVITLNAAEADDVERERRRQSLGEPYRTLVGHFRHESGHYYWDRLVRSSSALLEAFRALFGDERADYGQALKAHHERKGSSDWQERFISAYATAHPWEDWAETWAHYLHMTDALETAAACGLALRPSRKDEPTIDSRSPAAGSFERMLDDWFPLTYVLNSLNRGLGLADGYPFVLSAPVVTKLQFVHDMVSTAPPIALSHQKKAG